MCVYYNISYGQTMAGGQTNGSGMGVMVGGSRKESAVSVFTADYTRK